MRFRSPTPFLLLFLAPLVLGASIELLSPGLLSGGGAKAPSLDDCKLDQYATTRAYPQAFQKEASFCTSQFKQGLAVKKLTTWTDGKAWRGLRVTYNDDQITNIGKQGKADEDTINWDQTTVSIKYINVNTGDYVKGMYVELMNGENLEAGEGAKEWANQNHCLR
jgi:hypothetical protein